jgi:hypothetical protein
LLRSRLRRRSAPSADHCHREGHMIGRLVKAHSGGLQDRKQRRAGPRFKGQERMNVLGSSLFQRWPGQTVNIVRSRRATVIRLARCFVSTCCRSEHRMAASIPFFHSFLSSWHTSQPSRGRSTDVIFWLLHGRSRYFLWTGGH